MPSTSASATSWVGYRVPAADIAIAWTMSVEWAGLLVAHLVNLSLGDEQLTASGTFLIVFDCAMAALSAIAMWRTYRAQVLAGGRVSPP